ncbi:hypothetical protein E6W39_01870 [Kitasatospora acidiphila]|uniref:DUF5709 domain-containing protein n=1 Tax=Kitasatospora acidiphila TaxID=2567942 RepID=A0A540VWS1_9ACTN|nr:DUF5709 domain-containing protein [Kitasatospora acidiphila]TQF01213.1 hypothetical protein E6W39_01870 [Kitasatospora acidiphila]
MTDWDDRDFIPVEDDGVLQPADSLESDRLGDDPLDTGLTTSGGYRGATAYGTTPAEGNQGESLDQLLAAEEPDEPPDAVDDRWSDGPRPRAGRLVPGPDDTLASDVGRDCGAASAEEAAVHVTDADDDADAQLGDATEPESLSEAIRYAILDDLEGATHSDDYR